MREKMPHLLCRDGLQAKALRHTLKLTQGAFWGRIGATQSGGSRYESGREMPAQIAYLLHITYADANKVDALVTWLREH